MKIIVNIKWSPRDTSRTRNLVFERISAHFCQNDRCRSNSESAVSIESHHSFDEWPIQFGLPRRRVAASLRANCVAFP